MCAPSLTDHGAGRQTDEWVVATLRGEMSWCIAVDEAGTTGPDRSEADEVWPRPPPSPA